MWGLIADVYFNKKHVANYHDDGWGGEPEVTFFDDLIEKKVFDYLRENKVEKHMQSTDWSGELWKDGIEQPIVLQCAIEIIASEMEHLKWIKRNQSNKLILQKNEDIFTMKLNVSIARIKKNPYSILKFKKVIQEQIEDGYTILNTNLKGIINS